MKILTLCYEYPPLGGGGGRVAQSIARELVARGHDVRVHTAALCWKSTTENDRGVQVVRTASGRVKADTCRVHEMGLYCATSFWPAFRSVLTWHPDVIHAHFAVPTGFLAWPLSRLTGVPYVITAHLGDVPGGVPEQTGALFDLVDPIAWRIWTDAAARTAVSSFVQRLATQAYDLPVVRILNGISLAGGVQFPPSLPASLASPRRFVFAGRLSVQKNPFLLIEALARLPNRAWHLDLIGDGPLMPEVRACLARPGLGANVTLHGWLPADAVQHILHTGHVLVMPSLSEGLPVAAIEALKHGLALVASDIPGMDDVLDHGGNGFRVPLGDAPAFADALQRLIADTSLLESMRQASLVKVRAFDLRAVTHQYETVLRYAAESVRGGDARSA